MYEILTFSAGWLNAEISSPRFAPLRRSKEQTSAQGRSRGQIVLPEVSVREVISVLEDPQVQKLMMQVAKGILPAQSLLEVRSEPVEDSEGQQALRITLVLSEEAIEILTPDQIVSLLTVVHDRLQQEGDERFPLLGYATPSDLIERSEHEE
jgi:hypothetical protein